MSDFILISGMAIIRKDDIREVVPSFDETFDVEVIPPKTSQEEFTFNIIKEIEISLEIVRKETASSKKKDDSEVLVDTNSSTIIRDVQSLNYDDMVEKLFNDDEKLLGKLPASVKNYTKRLRKQEEYLEKMTTIQSNTSDPNYQNLLQAIQESAPSRESIDKQAESFVRITNLVKEQLFSVLESSSDEDEEADSSIFDYFNSEETTEHVTSKVENMLRTFYVKNFLSDDYAQLDDMEGTEDNITDDSDIREVDVEADVKRASDILKSEATIRNVIEDEKEDEETDEEV